MILRGEVNGDEIFTFGSMRFNISVILQGIEEGVVKYEKKKVPIREWAEGILLLDREKPESRRMSIWMSVDHDRIASMTPERLKVPAILADTKFGNIFIDGNHRIGRSYLDGADDLEVVYLSRRTMGQIKKASGFWAPKSKISVD
jgi:hypothetical protein